MRHGSLRTIAATAAMCIGLPVVGARALPVVSETGLTLSRSNGVSGTTVTITPDFVAEGKCELQWDHRTVEEFACGGGRSVDYAATGTPGRHEITVVSVATGPSQPTDPVTSAGTSSPSSSPSSSSSKPQRTAAQPVHFADPFGTTESADFVILSVVPSLLRRGVADAADAVRSAGLGLGHGWTGAGEITAQQPAAGEQVPPDTRVDVTVGGLKNLLITVPDLRGLSVRRAVALLRSRELELGPTTGSGQIVDQDPAAGSTVAAGAVVAVVLRTSPATVTVPDLRHRTLEDARSISRDAGLGLAVRGRGRGPVLTQSPGPGTRVRRGTTVDVTAQLLIARASPWGPAAAPVVGSLLIVLALLFPAGWLFLHARATRRNTRHRRAEPVPHVTCRSTFDDVRVGRPGPRPGPDVHLTFRRTTIMLEGRPR